MQTKLVAASLAALILATAHPAVSAPKKLPDEIVGRPLLYCDDPGRVHFILEMREKGIPAVVAAATLNWLFQERLCRFAVALDVTDERDVESFFLGENSYTIQEWKFVIGKHKQVGILSIMYTQEITGYRASIEPAPHA
jgi:hypothetical protein